VPHSIETIRVAIDVAVHELNQRKEPEESDSAKRGNSVGLKRNRAFAYAIAGPFYEKGGPVNFLINKLLHWNTTESSDTKWVIMNEVSEGKKTIFVIKRAESTVRITVQEVGERISQMSATSTPTVLGEFSAELDKQLKWRQ